VNKIRYVHPVHGFAGVGTNAVYTFAVGTFFVPFTQLYTKLILYGIYNIFIVKVCSYILESGEFKSVLLLDIPIISRSVWNCYKKRHRTNNIVEGWNSRLNKILNIPQPTFIYLYNCLKREAEILICYMNAVI
jgi:hypothetical protein